MPLGGLTVDQLEEELSDFSCRFNGDEEFVEKMNAFSHQFHLEADDLINEIITYATNLKKSDLDVAFLESFELYYKKKKAPAPISKTRTVLADLKPTGTPRRNIKLDTSSMDVDDDPAEVSMSQFANVNAPQYLSEFIIQDAPSGPGWFVNRSDPGKVVSKLGGDVSRERSATKSQLDVVVQPLTAAKKQTYGEPKAAGVLEGMNARLEAYGRDVRAANAETLGEAPFAALNAEGESEVFIIGFVCEFDPRGDVSTIELVRDEENGAVTVTVDVTALDERCFFPGQMAVLKGVNRTGSMFEATSRLSAERQKSVTVRTGDEDACVWVAVGPFTPPTTVAYEPLAEIVHRAREEQPDVLLLVGPLVDRQSSFLLSKECTVTDDDLTHRLLTRIAKNMKGSSTRVLFMPSSSRDASVLPVFPGATLRQEWSGGVVDVVSDPVSLTVGGAQIAVTASDILTHLSRCESHTSANKENTDRMKRVAGHMLEQRSLYPLHPPSLSTSLEGIHAACSMNGQQPHMIVSPSMLAPFVKSPFGCVVANPGTACKGSSAGTMLKMRIGLSEIPEEGTTSLERYTHVSVAKI